MKSIIVGVAALSLVGCATQSTLPGAYTSGAAGTSAVTKSPSRVYPATYAITKAAALEAVHALNVNVQSSNEDAAGFHINFSKAISAFSWGEVGRVDVVQLPDGKIRVDVIASKRLKTQLTGTSQKEFASEIFEGIDRSLARLGG